MKLIAPVVHSFLFWKKHQSIMWSTGHHSFNNFSLLQPVNSFFSSFILFFFYCSLQIIKVQLSSVSGTVNIEFEN